ncbi:histidine kinase [Rubrivirga sp. S365]|uniref:sensor histidine kinase n=1 Tax=Rubrivirga sp. S365 TaxID=3076080 RepID=UPI0028C73747|nr:ATP-binding protein [Rubrivirga sp. S365]MDT7858171.1 histidine kinase [Rubrivirga sp. S365]
MTRSAAPPALALLALATVAGAQAPPTPVAALHADSLVVDSLVWGEGRTVWPYAFVRTAPHGETWMRLDDPYGGAFFGPSTMVAALGEEARAFAERREARSVLLLPRALTLSALALIAVGLVAGSALPFVWYRRRYWKERARREAAESARRHLAEGREAERVRTAQDLHDGPVQDLHALRMRLAVLARGADDGLRAALAETATEARSVVEELRRVAEDLRPPALGPFGLAAALRAHAARFADRHPGLDVALDLDDDGQALPEPVRLALFRVAQEAMTNAAKHAGAGRVSVALRVGPGAVEVEVADDGAGYAVPADLLTPSAPGHYGLVGMAERAEAVGAALAVESGAGRGTRVRASVPVVRGGPGAP